MSKKKNNILKKHNKNIKTYIGGLTGKILAAAVMLGCLVCMVGLMWGRQENRQTGASAYILDDPVEGYGFHSDEKGTYILLNSAGEGSSMTIKTKPESVVTGLSFYTQASINGEGKQTKSNNTNVAEASFVNPGAATCSSFALLAKGGGKTKLDIKILDDKISPPAVEAISESYDVYIQPHFNGVTEESIDINSKEELVIGTNILGYDDSIGYIISKESDFDSALKSTGSKVGILNGSDDINSGLIYGGSGEKGIEWKWNGKQFTVKHNKSVGVFYLYLYIRNSDENRDSRIEPVKCKVICRTTLSDVTVSLNKADSTLDPKSVNIKDIYNFEGFDDCFESSGATDCTYSSGIITGSTYEKTTGYVTLRCRKDSDCIFHEDGTLFKQGEALIVTVYTIDQLAFLEGGKLETEITEKKIAKGGIATLSFVYTTSTVPTWTCDDVSIATVDKGVIRGINPGKTVIRGSVISGGIKKEIVCNVTVVDSKEVLSISHNTYQATLGNPFYLAASGSSVSTSKWTVSNEEILQIGEVVNSDGMRRVEIVPKKTGTAVVSIYNAENAIMASCSVSVGVVPSKIEFTNGLKLLNLNMATKTYQLTVNMTPSDPFAPLIWQSNNTKVAEVDQNGLVTLKGPGVAIIQVVPQYYQQISATMTINVTQPATGLTIDIPEATLSVGEKIKLSYTIVPETTTNKNVTWYSMNTKVATVDKNGLVTAKSIGQTYIYAVSQDGSFLAFSTINVVQAATGVKLDVSNLSLKVGDVYYVQSTFAPANATDKNLTWTVQDPKICTVANSGKVTAKSPGTTTIFAKTTSGEIAYLYVTVQSNVLGLALDKPEKTVIAGKKFKLNPIFTPAEPTNTKVTWKSSNTGVATVDKEGKVVTKKVGMAIILCTSADGGYLASCSVTVKPGVSALAMDETEIKMLTGKTRKLTVTFTPEHPSSRKLTWKSSNPSVATVNDKGKVKALKGGSTVITCTSSVGNVSASCVVSVEQLVSYIKLSKDTVNVGLGKTYQLKGTVDSNDVTNKQLKWSSTKNSIATIDKNGNITGKKLGKCTVICRATDGSKAKAKCTVNVIRQMTSLSLDKSTIRILVGKSTRIRAIVRPSNASIKKVAWSSTDESIATVDVNGNIYAVAEGVCKIRAKAMDGSNKRAECWLYVLPRVEASSVVISQKDLYLPVGTTEDLQVSVLPSNNTDSISFSSDNKLIATVNQNGRVRAIRPGQATITCVTSSGKSATSSVTVLGLNWENLNLNLYETQTLRLEGMTTGVIWESEDPTVATVASNGLVTSRKAGSTRIIASVKGIKLYCRVTVNDSL